MNNTIVSGTLWIKCFQQDNKRIKTGWLECFLGRFNVNYERLNALETGQYEGFFEIAEIRQQCYKNDKGYYFEPEAVLNKVAFYFTEKNPCELKGDQRKKSANERLQPSLELESNPTHLLELVSPDDPELFGALWPLGKEIHLDYSQSRDRLRTQCGRLQTLGYNLDETSQIWHKAA